MSPAFNAMFSFGVFPANYFFVIERILHLLSVFHPEHVDLFQLANCVNPPALDSPCNIVMLGSSG